MYYVPVLAQPGAAPSRCVAKMVAVENQKCASIHTCRVDRVEYTVRVLSVHLLLPPRPPPPDLSRNTALRTQTKYSEYGECGYWNTAQVLPAWEG